MRTLDRGNSIAAEDTIAVLADFGNESDGQGLALGDGILVNFFLSEHIQEDGGVVGIAGLKDILLGGLCAALLRGA